MGDCVSNFRFFFATYFLFATFLMNLQSILMRRVNHTPCPAPEVTFVCSCKFCMLKPWEVGLCDVSTQMRWLCSQGILSWEFKGSKFDETFPSVVHECVLKAPYFFHFLAAVQTNWFSGKSWLVIWLPDYKEDLSSVIDNHCTYRWLCQ